MCDLKKFDTVVIDEQYKENIYDEVLNSKIYFNNKFNKNNANHIVNCKNNILTVEDIQLDEDMEEYIIKVVEPGASRYNFAMIPANLLRLATDKEIKERYH